MKEHNKQVLLSLKAELASHREVPSEPIALMHTIRHLVLDHAAMLMTQTDVAADVTQRTIIMALMAVWSDAATQQLDTMHAILETVCRPYEQEVLV
jgi:hypothetical protein